MLGEITHLQGIIDDLVVLTAEPHKLPPASEQVRPPLESRAETGTREETVLVLPSCRERVDKRGRCLGRHLGEDDQKLSHSPWEISVNTCPGDV